MLPRVRILTPCTARKRAPALLDAREVRSAAHIFRQAWRLGKNINNFNGLDEFYPAVQLYSGLHHQQVIQGVELYREHGGAVELAILSAGYGLIPEVLSGGEHTRILSYEATFSGMRKADILRISRELDIPDDVMRFLLAPGCDLQFVLLGSSYLHGAHLPRDLRFPCITYFLSAPSAPIPVDGVKVPLGMDEARLFGATLVSLKGVLMFRMLKRMTEGWTPPEDAHALLRDLATT